MRAIIFTADGFEDSELSYPYYRLQKAGHEVDIATPDGEAVEVKHGYEFEADLAIDAREPDAWVADYDLLVLPGGSGPEGIRIDAPEAAETVAAFDAAGQPIAAICHGAQLLVSADVLAGQDATSYWGVADDVEAAGGTWHDESVVVDDNLVTSRVPDDLPDFMRETFVLLEDVEAEPAATAD